MRSSRRRRAAPPAEPSGLASDRERIRPAPSAARTRATKTTPARASVSNRIGQPEWGDRGIELEADHIQHGPQCTGAGSSGSCGRGPSCRNRRPTTAGDGSCVAQPTPLVSPSRSASTTRAWLDTGIVGLRIRSRDRRCASGGKSPDARREPFRGGSDGRSRRFRDSGGSGTGALIAVQPRKPRPDGTAGASLCLPAGILRRRAAPPAGARLQWLGRGDVHRLDEPPDRACRGHAGRSSPPRSGRPR